MKMGRNEWIMLLVLSMVFGGAFFFMDVGVETFQPMTFAWCRVSLAAVILWVIVLLRGSSLPTRWQPYAAFLVLGLFNNVIPFSLIAWGQITIDSSLSSIANATTPLWTVLVAGALLPDERFTWLKVLGVLMGAFGVACMMGLEAFSNVSLANVTAIGAVVLAAFSYAIGGWWGRRFHAWKIDPVVVATGQVTAGGLIMLPMVLWIDPLWAYFGTAPLEAWGAVLGIAVLSTAFAYVLFFRILAAAGATNLSLTTFLVPIWATLLGVSFRGDTLGATHFLGALIIGLALVLIDGRLVPKGLRPGKPAG